MRRKHRKSLRLPNYDYASPGAYFVTICAWRRKLLFDIPGAREAVQTSWEGLLGIFGGIELDEFVIMSNHAHGIVWIVAGGLYRLHPGTWGSNSDSIDENRERGRRGEQLLAPPTSAPTSAPTPAHTTPASTPPPPIKPVVLGNIVGAFKTAASSAINNIRKTPGQPVWQPNYYEHIIRNDRELLAIRQYIQDNPLRWALDLDNPANWARMPPPETVDDYLRHAGLD